MKESCGSGGGSLVSQDERVVTYFCVVLYSVYVITNGMNNHLVFFSQELLELGIIPKEDCVLQMVSD